jgi:omega-amidase
MSTLTITTIQANLFWEDKATNLQRFEEKIMSIRENTELVILPEMFSTGFSMEPGTLAERMDGASMAWMRNCAAKKKIILTGSLIIEDGGNYFNRLIWMQPDGRFGYYDKRHRFAYAGEDTRFTAGNKRLIASVKGWKILLLVCYDLRFPVWARQNPPIAEPSPGTGHSVADAPEYDLAVFVANWPERRSHAWKTLLQARAIENQSYVAGVNRVGNDGNNIYYRGDSMIVDPLGEVLYQGSEKEDIFTYTLRKDKLVETRDRLPFWRDADHFAIEP